MATSPDTEDHFARAMRAFLRGQLKPGGADCPHPALLLALREGKLTEEEAGEVEAHLARCSICQEQVSTLERLAEEAAADASDEAVEDVAQNVVEDVAEDPPLVLAAALDSTEEEDAEPTADTVETDLAFRPVDPTASPRSPRLGLLALGIVALAVGAVAYRYPPLVVRAPRDLLDVWLGAPLKEPVGTTSAAISATIAPEPDPPPQPAPPAEEPVSPPPAQALFEEPPVAPVPPAIEQVTKPEAPKPAPRVETASAPRKERPRPPEPAREERRALEEAVREEPAAIAPGNRVVVARSDPRIVWRLAGPSVERSADGGRTWEPQGSSSSSDLLAASAPSAAVCWAAGRRGTVVRTTDGESWESVSKPSAEDLVQVTAWNATSATVKSASGRRYSTADGGATWSRR